ncbi:MAG: hypothetical protein RL701_150, partial [Pseudomonadota bacterium]
MKDGFRAPPPDRKRRMTRRLARHPSRVQVATVETSVESGELGETEVLEPTSASVALSADRSASDQSDSDETLEPNVPYALQVGAELEEVQVTIAADGGSEADLPATDELEDIAPSAAIDELSADADSAQAQADEALLEVDARLNELAAQSAAAVPAAEPAPAVDAHALDAEPATVEFPRLPAEVVAAPTKADESPTREAAPAARNAAANANFAPIFSPLVASVFEAMESPAGADTSQVRKGEGEGKATSQRDDADIQTQPKIRLPDGSARKAGSPSTETALPPLPTSHGNGAGASRGTGPVIRSNVSPLPPAPAPAGHTGQTQLGSSTPTGEGIVRAPGTRAASRDSDLPTRPRIPLTHDMALAAGRITSQDVAPYNEDYAATRPRLAYPPAVPAASAEPPAVVVTRAHLISDRPPATGTVSANANNDAGASRPSRRARADSEDFETLDLEDTEGDVLRLDPTAPSPPPGNVTSLTGDVGLRVSRTPPPPPAATPARRMNTGPLGSSAGQRPGPPPPPPPTASAKKAPSLASTTPTSSGSTTGATPKTRSKKRAWWEVLFSDDYVKTLPRPSAGAVAKQISFMEASLGI